jgi:hypothetical protein
VLVLIRGAYDGGVETMALDRGKVGRERMTMRDRNDTSGNGKK